MARGINKVILIGNLGHDPSFKVTAGGMPVCNVSLATTERRKDKNGNYHDETEWRRVVFRHSLAEIVKEYCRKGSKVYIEGRIKTRKWQGQDGQDRYTTEIVANDMQMLGGRGGDGGTASYGGGGGGGSYGGGQPQQNARPQQGGGQSAPPPMSGPDDFDDDIPF